MSKILEYISIKENALYIVIYIVGFILVAIYYGLLSAVAMTGVILLLGFIFGMIIKFIYK